MSARSERPVAGVVPMVSRPEGAEQGSQDARVGGSRFEKTVAHAVTREGAGGAVAYAGFLAVIAGVIAGIGTFLPVWLASILVGLIVLGIGYVLVQRGQSGLKRADLMPRQTIATLKEDTEWVKDQTR